MSSKRTIGYKLNVNDFIGKKYDQLEVIGEAKSKNGFGKKNLTYAIVKCSCGTTFEKRLSEVIRVSKTTSRRHINRCINCFYKSSRKSGNFLPHHWFNNVIQNAKVRNLEVLITIFDCEDLWIKQKGICALSGLEITYPKRIRYKDEKGKNRMKYEGTASLDRIDSSLGYTLDNIQWIDKRINVMKMDMGDDEFINMCGLIYKKSLLLCGK